MLTLSCSANSNREPVIHFIGTRQGEAPKLASHSGKEKWMEKNGIKQVRAYLPLNMEK